MPGEFVEVSAGGVELLVRTVSVPGSQPTAGLDDARRKVGEAFDRVEGAIVEIAGRLAGAVKEMRARAVHPDSVEVEFGLAFTATGRLVVMQSSAEASLSVKISYSSPVDGA